MRSSILALFAAIAVAAATSTPDALDLDELVARGGVIEEREDSGDEWMDVSFGVMMERSPVPGTSLTTPVEERAVSAPVHQELILERDAMGEIKLPRSFEEGQEMAKRAVGHIKRDGMTKIAKRGFRAIITWYTGRDLLAPSCVSHSNWAPTDRSMVAALTITWSKASGKPKCGDFLKVKQKNGRKSIVVRVVDSCGGCASGSQHVDLTTGAFKKLYSLNTGLVRGVQVSVVRKPFKGKWTGSIKSLYGPQKL